MSDQVPVVNANLTRKFDPTRDGPQRGTFWWVKITESRYNEAKEKHEDVTEERLMCVTHIASNHLVFAESSPGGGRSTLRVRYRDLPELTRPELKWKEVIERQIEEKKVELQNAVKKLTDKMVSANLVTEQSTDAPEAPTSMLPALTRVSPEEHKQTLIRLKKEEFPAMEKEIEQITQHIVALHKDMMLPMRAETDRMKKGMEKVDNRLFALELYAGLFQECKMIARGKPADPETPISVRQMIRYMDEECLIDYHVGGMDYRNVGDFDRWVVKPENLNRIAPEPRCVVALQVRRESKQYDCPTDIMGWFRQMEEHLANLKTYLLIRNGGRVYRLATEIEFTPRLLPFRAEFHKPFEERERRSSWGKDHSDYKSWDEVTQITPDHLNYDEHVEKRMDEIYRYNRVMFLLQGLLDRSKVFSPHPPISLAEPEHIERYFRPVFDEEDGLPSYMPPVYEEYRDRLNSLLTVGNFIWSRWHAESDYEERHGRSSYRGLRPGRERPDITKVVQISRDRSKVHVTWAWGTTYGWRDHPTKPGYNKWMEYEVKKERHAWIPMKELFNVSAYKTKEYVPFLCDALQKGRYLKWAPPMLDSELWLKMTDQQRTAFSRYGFSSLRHWLEQNAVAVDQDSESSSTTADTPST